jgi:hypothetical protein
MADTDLDFIQILAEDGDLAKKLEKALKERIGRELGASGGSKRSPKKKEARDE